MFINPEEIIKELNLNGNEIVADFGAGSGVYSIEIAKILSRSGGEVYSIDIQPNILKSIAHTARDLRLKNVHCILADVEDIGGTKISNETVDFCIISNIMHALDKKHDALKEAIRITHIGGYILIIDWKDSYKSLGPSAERVFTENECIKMCLEKDLTLDKILDAGIKHFALLFRKNIDSNNMI